MSGRSARRRLAAWLAFAAASAAAAPGARAEPLDLSRFARVTASATRSTSLGLWPRESDDAPATVRDGEPATAWKAPPSGATLTLDFTPLAARAPRVARLWAEWSVAPRGDVVVRARDGCGGEVLAELTWSAAASELTVEPPVAASCWTLAVPGQGEPALAELHVFAAPSTEGPPEVTYLRGDLASVVAGNVRLLWDLPGAEPHHVDLHYLRDRSEPLVEANRVARSSSGRLAEVTLPAPGFTTVAAVGVAADGRRGAPVFTELPPRPAPPLAASGVVEGFYGRPWSHDERREMVVRLATSGLGFDLYAPKSDPLHRADWRTPYDAAALARFAELHELGRRVGVRFAMGISPGIDIAVGDPADRAALVAKLAPFVALGFRDFGLLLDDIEDALGRPVDAALGAEHRDLANTLLAALVNEAGEPVRLWLVPTVYSTERQQRFADGDGYLDALARLDPAIQVMWTGTDTTSRGLAAADLADVTVRLGRRVVIWDNEHANDGGDLFFGKIWLAPYSNRSADLIGAVAGVVANPMIQGALDRLVLPTYGAFLSGPIDPYFARRRAVELESAAGSLSDTLPRLMDMFRGHGDLHPEGVEVPIDAPMEEAIARFRAALPFGSRAEVARAGGELARVAAEMATAHERLAASDLAPDLVDDLWYPTERLVHEGRALLETLDFARSHLAGWSADVGSLEEAKALYRRALRDRFQASPLVAQYLAWTLEDRPPRSRNLDPPPIARPPSRARVGEPLAWRATPRDARVEVYGIPFWAGAANGSRVEGRPAAPGRYRGIAVVSDDRGWNWRDVDIVVER